MASRRCTVCGAEQQWSMWRQCHCGGEFGPPSLPTPEASPSLEARLRYETFLPRIGAAFVDGLVVGSLGPINAFLFDPKPGTLMMTGSLITHYSATVLYSVLMHARYGQTLGKMAVGIKVLHASETRTPTIREALLREIGYVIPGAFALFLDIRALVTGQYRSGVEIGELPWHILYWVSIGWFLAEVVSMLSNEKRRAIHDLIAGTVVVNGTEHLPARS